MDLKYANATVEISISRFIPLLQESNWGYLEIEIAVFSTIV